jgi:hypothetical protein
MSAGKIGRIDQAGSYLAFDVYFAEFYADNSFVPIVDLLFKSVLSTMGFKEFTAADIVLEAELVRKEAERDVHIALHTVSLENSKGGDLQTF